MFIKFPTLRAQSGPQDNKYSEGSEVTVNLDQLTTMTYMEEGIHNGPTDSAVAIRVQGEPGYIVVSEKVATWISKRMKIQDYVELETSPI